MLKGEKEGILVLKFDFYWVDSFPSSCCDLFDNGETDGFE